jgi:hypothetical protein
MEWNGTGVIEKNGHTVIAATRKSTNEELALLLAKS